MRPREIILRNFTGEIGITFGEREIAMAKAAVRMVFRPTIESKTIFPELGKTSCLFGPAAMFACDFLTVILTRGQNPLEMSISQYALGPFGWLEKAGIVTVSAAFALIARDLLSDRNKPRNLETRVAGALYLGVAAGFLLVSLFNVDTGSTQSFHGSVHMVGAIGVTLIFPIACLVLLLGLIGDAKSKTLAFYSAITGLVGVGAALWMAFPANRANSVGLFERLLAAFNLVWVVVAGSLLAKPHSPMIRVRLPELSAGR